MRVAASHLDSNNIPQLLYVSYSLILMGAATHGNINIYVYMYGKVRTLACMTNITLRNALEPKRCGA